ncbi:hypothetical protein ACA910_014999 [Epithemia clementina (nom. ined.)]
MTIETANGGGGDGGDDAAPLLSPKVVVISKEDERQEETKRRRLSEVPISEVLKAKHNYRWVDPVIMQHQTVRQAIVAAVEGGLSGMMVLEPVHKRVVGLVTTRDLLRIMSAGLKENEPAEAVMNRVIGDYMTHISQVIYGRPEETIGVARTLMAKLRIKCLPILSKDWKVEGLLTARDMSDYGLSAQELGGKRAYLKDVSERVGLSSDTSMAEPPTYLKAHLALEQNPLFVNVGTAALPHPYKTPDSYTVSGRDRQLLEPTTDLSLSDDSYFVTSVTLPDAEDKNLRKFTYVGVADGVGSWREYGVDPRQFSHRLMEECQNILYEASRNGQEEGDKFRQVISPAQIMGQAYERVKAHNVIGSTTCLIGLLDGLRHQLHFSNLGDCGLIVLRHIDSDVAGSLKRERRIPRTDRKSDMQVAFVSQQQLYSFNHPYQLGWTGDPVSYKESKSFKLPRESCTSSVHVRRGDIILMATDGLFDNVELDDITALALEWEQQHGFVRAGDVSQRERRWAMGNSLSLQSQEHIADLCHALADRARENSMNPQLDSPFAILAKENDVMWSGGMPDDVTVVGLHVVGRDAEDWMAGTHM